MLCYGYDSQISIFKYCIWLIFLYLTNQIYKYLILDNINCQITHIKYRDIIYDIFDFQRLVYKLYKITSIDFTMQIEDKGVDVQEMEHRLDEIIENTYHHLSYKQPQTNALELLQIFSDAVQLKKRLLQKQELTKQQEEQDKTELISYAEADAKDLQSILVSSTQIFNKCTKLIDKRLERSQSFIVSIDFMKTLKALISTNLLLEESVKQSEKLWQQLLKQFKEIHKKISIEPKENEQKTSVLQRTAEELRLKIIEKTKERANLKRQIEISEGKSDGLKQLYFDSLNQENIKKIEQLKSYKDRLPKFQSTKAQKPENTKLTKTQLGNSPIRINFIPVKHSFDIQRTSAIVLSVITILTGLYVYCL